MKEPPNNIRLLCSKCAPKPDPRYRQMPMETFFGKNCKLVFPVGPTKEHMWVYCTGLAKGGKGKLGGTLDNEPVVATELQYGDWVEFRRSQIEDVAEVST